ncbi:UNVERIFIED_CONTAM: RNA-binding protein 42 [Sesamum latifolium]|uniref:RNA-binding protein 42 n=1 Tax=Sesamum latifolium TaxID=2727402 RepID=A0AAW2VVM9_9LAMI
MATGPSTTAAAAASSSSQYTYSAATTSYFPTPFHLQQTPPPPPVPYIGAAPPPTVPAVPLPVYPAPPTVQAQQLFQRDAQTITPEAIESVKAALASSDIEHKAETKKKAIPRKAAGRLGRIPPLQNGLRMTIVYFVVILEMRSYQCISDEECELCTVTCLLEVVRDKRTGKTKGYGFVSFSNPTDLVGALKEMNGKYVGNRPIKLRKSTWTERTDAEALEDKRTSLRRRQSYRRKVYCTNECLGDVMCEGHTGQKEEKTWHGFPM